MPPSGVFASELISVPVSSCAFVSMFNFRLYNPSDCPRFVYHFLIVFCFDLFLSGVVLSFRGTMASANNDKEKTPLKEDCEDPKLKEEVESEAKEEEMEEYQSPHPSTIIASIGVVTSHDKFKKSADKKWRRCSTPSLSFKDIFFRQQPLPYSHI
jgi:hypothetical protein